MHTMSVKPVSHSGSRPARGVQQDFVLLSPHPSQEYGSDKMGVSHSLQSRKKATETGCLSYHGSTILSMWSSSSWPTLAHHCLHSLAWEGGGQGWWVTYLVVYFTGFRHRLSVPTLQLSGCM